MHCTGIICEYNPFHHGHRYHIQETVRLTGGNPVVAVMSSNYVQRAEPAVTDKWRRTAMALHGGASLVIEIPTCCSTASSEFYAGAGVHLLNSTGIVSHISFGVENADTHLLETVSNIVFQEPEDYTILLKKYMAAGLGYAAARAQALADLTDCDPELLKSPNFILAVEYYKALARFKADLTPLPILRRGQYHDPSMEVSLPSASAIRQAIYQDLPFKEALPATSFQLLTGNAIADPLDAWSQELYYRLCFHTAESLKQIPDVAEGLENRILKYADRPRLISELIPLLSTKRYPHSRIRRILLRILLDIQQLPKPAYIRVLGFRKEHQHLLSEMTARATLPVITNLPRQLHLLPGDIQQQLKNEIRYTDLYVAHVPNTDLHRGAELTQPLVVT